MPDQFANMICAMDFGLSPSPDIVVALPEGEASGKPLLLEIHRHYLPNKVVTVKDCRLNGGQGGDLAETSEPLLLRGKGLQAGKPAVFLCENFTCQKPITQLKELRKELTARATAKP